jgi:CHAT domain-containing protein
LGYRAEARELYDTLLAPLAPFVLGNEPLYFVPDGPLWSLPFQTLVAPSGAHLAETRPIAVAPSLAILHSQMPRRDAGAGLLAFANPRVEGASRETVRAAAPDLPLGPLPETEEEVRAISALYKGDTVHIGNHATESAFKKEASRYRILHLATHGFVASGAPMYSGLIFSNDEENDGILEAREVADMTLGADLAVLSACDTGSGRISEGEGMVGLSWAFLAAGCPTTIVSQWKADSAATAKLMIELHRRITQGDSAAQALRRAQKSLMRSETHWHPYYWAPFIVVGRDHAISPSGRTEAIVP